MDEFDALTTAKLKAAYAALPKTARPDYYLMNWSTWCKARRALKARGIPVTYVRVSQTRWRRYVEGVEIMLDRWIVGDEIYELTNSLPVFVFGERPSLPKTTVRRLSVG